MQDCLQGPMQARLGLATDLVDVNPTCVDWC